MKNKSIQAQEGSDKVKIKYFRWTEFAVIFLIFGCLTTLQIVLFLGVDELQGRGYAYIIPGNIFSAIIAALVCFFTGYIRYRTFDKPFRALSCAAKKVAGGDFSVHLDPVHKINKRDYIDIMFEDFNKMAAELGTLETLKTDFTTNVSHEMKTPLSVIESYAAALQDPNLTEATKQEYTDAIIESSQKLGVLVSNILKLSKLENEVISSGKKQYDLCRQLADCALGFENLWERKHINFEADLEDQAIVCADPDMMEIVWNNLLSNAVKFTELGGRVSLVQTSTATNIIVKISDTGCGISSKDQNHVFDKFYQADTSHSGEGNGLGLALVRRAIETAHGTISVSSETGKGSTFTVTLPLYVSTIE